MKSHSSKTFRKTLSHSQPQGEFSEAQNSVPPYIYLGSYISSPKILVGR